MGVNNLAKVITQRCLAGNRTHNLSVASPTPNDSVTTPHSTVTPQITEEKIKNIQQICNYQCWFDQCQRSYLLSSKEIYNL